MPRRSRLSVRQAGTHHPVDKSSEATGAASGAGSVVVKNARLPMLALNESISVRTGMDRFGELELAAAAADVHDAASVKH